MIGKLAFRFAKSVSRSRLLGRPIGFGFQCASFAIPGRRVSTDKLVVGFYHPKPAFSEHILIVPKRAIHTFPELLEEQNSAYLEAILTSGTTLVDTFGWTEYSFGVNGGRNQEVCQVHFHLYRETVHSRPVSAETQKQSATSKGDILIGHHPNPMRELHLVISSDGEGMAWLSGLGKLLDGLIEEHNLIENGYTIFVQYPDKQSDHGPMFHLVSVETRS